jgi:hypothetical protein
MRGEKLTTEALFIRVESRVGLQGLIKISTPRSRNVPFLS